MLLRVRCPFRQGVSASGMASRPAEPPLLTSSIRTPLCPPPWSAQLSSFDVARDRTWALTSASSLAAGPTAPPPRPSPGQIIDGACHSPCLPCTLLACDGHLTVLPRRCGGLLLLPMCLARNEDLVLHRPRVTLNLIVKVDFDGTLFLLVCKFGWSSRLYASERSFHPAPSTSRSQPEHIWPIVLFSALLDYSCVVGQGWGSDRGRRITWWHWRCADAAREGGWRLRRWSCDITNQEMPHCNCCDLGLIMQDKVACQRCST